jgi:excisionase family DNA binding protein
MSDKLLTTKEAARFLGVSEAFLERDRWAGARIPFIKVGSRAVRYRPQDLETFLRSRTHVSTAGAGGAR